ncbi:Vacuolar protein sorting-associated protein 70 [Marasmius tenuissimus]|uniref:Vacuolar protein sorting-associated protein 70 n=1 Tax=Marasmius tenuissimus TaxID=585030 RepID=A0ABR3A7X3_9AGAR
MLIDMSGKVLDSEKQASLGSVSRSARNQTSRTKRVVVLICLSTALCGLYGFRNLWSEARAPREVHYRPPPLGEKEKETLPTVKVHVQQQRPLAVVPMFQGLIRTTQTRRRCWISFRMNLVLSRHGNYLSSTLEHLSLVRRLSYLPNHRPQHQTAWIDVYYPELDTPTGRSLDILDEKGKSVWKADLDEDGDPLDEDAHEFKDFVPAWDGFSSNGDAEGQIIYANYGTKKDYDKLLEAGANFTGKIVLTRYGKITRSLKVLRNWELLVSSSTPTQRDDGYVTVENGYTPYPQGPARNPTLIQKGSVMYLTKYVGDPTMPGYPAYEGAERQTPVNLAKIPSLSLLWRNAQHLLEEIEEIYVPREPAVNGRRKLSGKHSVSKIRLANHVDYNVTPIRNTMAAIPSHVKDEVVIVGCHRDAWVLGAADPISELHLFTRLQGWEPLRTILIASWDVVEHGLISSTEVEQVVPEDIDVALDLVALRSSIESLQAASLELDVEKVAAEKNFYEALKKLPKFPHPSSYYRCSGGFTRRVADWYRSVFGSPERPHDHIRDWMDFFSEDLEDEDALSRLPFSKNPWREFFKAVKRLVKANGKIIAFERGFLDEGGIVFRDRVRCYHFAGFD